MTVTFGGISSGLDTTAIVTALVSAESAPLTTMKTKQTNVDSAASTLQGFASSIASLRTAAATLADPSQFASFTASSSSAAIVPAATGALPVAGSYAVQVDALAQEQRTYSDPQTSSTAALGFTGTLSLTGATSSINITAGESLTDIATAIGASGAKVSANVLFDGTQYRLQVRGLASGSANAITFGESGFSLGLSNSANTPQKAQNASVTLDGISYSRSTNNVVGVIPGVSLALTQTTAKGSPAVIQIASDPQALETKIQSFVSAYNFVVNAGHADGGYGTIGAQNSALQSDRGIRHALDSMSSLVDSPINGASGSYSSLGEVGLNVQSDGTLSFDTTKFETALANDGDSVTKLFTTTSSDPKAGIMSAFETMADGLTGKTGSAIDGEVASFQAQSKNMQKEEQNLQTQITNYQTRLQAQFSTLESQINKYKSLDATILNAAFPGMGGNSSSNNNNSGGGISFGTVKTSG